MLKRLRQIVIEGRGANSRQLRHYTALIRNDNGKLQLASPDFSADFKLPREMGVLKLFTHDRGANEVEEDYIDRCSKEIQKIVRNAGENSFVFFAYGTVMSGSETYITDLQERFLKKCVTMQDVGNVRPGHLAVYTAEGAYLSHQPSVEHITDQKDIILHDVKKSVKESQKTSTYLAVLNRVFFPEVTLKKLITTTRAGVKYDWYAAGESDNCTTLIQRVFTGRKERLYMNPISTLNLLVKHVANNAGLIQQEINDLNKELLNAGVVRTLFEVSMDEFDYKDGFALSTHKGKENLSSEMPKI